jgi:hypothetical protein
MGTVRRRTGMGSGVTTALQLHPDTNRTIAEVPAYVITDDGEVWSRLRTTAGKSGSVRTLQPHRIKPDAGGRVSLSQHGVVERYGVDWLFRRYWPEIAYPKYQYFCRKGHALVGANIAVWGCGNRVCLVCNPGWTPPTRARGNHRMGRIEIRRDNPDLADLTASAHGWRIESGGGGYARGNVMPVELAALLCRVDGTPWGAGNYSPGCLSPMVGTSVQVD